MDGESIRLSFNGMVCSYLKGVLFFGGELVFSRFGDFSWISASLLLCFSASPIFVLLLLCFSASLLFFLSAFLLLCFPRIFASQA